MPTLYPPSDAPTRGLFVNIGTRCGQGATFSIFFKPDLNIPI